MSEGQLIKAHLLVALAGARLRRVGPSVDAHQKIGLADDLIAALPRNSGRNGEQGSDWGKRQRSSWPADLTEQVLSVRRVLAAEGQPLDVADVARRYQRAD